MNRRGFLAAMLAACAAPAVVRASSLMKLAPISKSGILGYIDNVKATTGDVVYIEHPSFMAESQAYEFGDGDWTIEHWGKLSPLNDNEYHHLAKVRQNGAWTYYVDGKKVSQEDYSPQDPLSLNGGIQTHFVSDLRITGGFARPKESFLLRPESPKPIQPSSLLQALTTRL